MAQVDQNLSTVAFLLTHHKVAEALQAYVLEANERLKHQEQLATILLQLDIRTKTARDMEKWSHEQVGVKTDSHHRGFYAGAESIYRDEAIFLEQLAKDLRQVLATPTKAI